MGEIEIVESIKTSKRYKGLYSKTIERVVVDCVARFGLKRAKKEAKNLLHQIWGAFYKTRPEFKKIVCKLEKDSVLPLLKLQSSVEERIPILDNFYQKIFEITGIPNSIIDHACGLNPLTIPWMNLPKIIKYTAFDIDAEEIEFLKSIGIDARLGDLLSDDFEYADVVFMLKLLPCLEHQKKGCSLEILKKQKCKFLVVSFPIKSIGGKEKGMASFYGNNFKDMVKSENWKITELLFETELVFVIKK